MATTSITIRMDEKLKKQAEILFEDMGLNMTKEHWKNALLRSNPVNPFRKNMT